MHSQILHCGFSGGVEMCTAGTSQQASRFPPRPGYSTYQQAHGLSQEGAEPLFSPSQTTSSEADDTHDSSSYCRR